MEDIRGDSLWRVGRRWFVREGHAGLRRLGMSKRILVTCSKKQSGLETHFLGGC